MQVTLSLELMKGFSNDEFVAACSFMGGSDDDATQMDVVAAVSLSSGVGALFS